MTEIPRGTWPTAGTWNPLFDVGGGPVSTVLLRCPAGHGAALDHAIAADGTVSPSVVCPESGCGWHENVRLVGWEYGVLPERPRGG